MTQLAAIAVSAIAAAILFSSPFAAILPVHYAMAQIEDDKKTASNSGSTTTVIDEKSTKELRLIVKLFKTVSKLESKDKLNDTTVNIPVTLLIPVSVEGENIQVCFALLSSSDFTCQQVIINNDNDTVTASDASSLNDTSSAQSANNGTNARDKTGGSATDDASKQLQLAIKVVKTAARLDSKGELENATINIPITLIIPISVEGENAQVCLSILSSGDMNCQQIIINNENQTVSTMPVTDDTSSTTTATDGNATDFGNANGTIAADSDDDDGSSTSSNQTDNTEDGNNSETNDTSSSGNGTSSDEPCVTPCPPDQYCIQMCRPAG